MTLNEADNQIAQWLDKQALIEQNLQSFMQLPAFQRLASSTAHATTTQVFDGLRAQQQLLSQTIEKAKALRESLPAIMPSRQILAEIDQLLNGNSIQLASSPTPPQRRELLRDLEQAEWISLARLLEIMLDSFRFVRDTALSIDQAEAEQQRDAADRLANANVILTQLQSAHARATQLLSERILKVDGPRNTSLLPCSQEELTALETWLTKLKSTVEGNEFGSAAIGLSRWTDAATELLTQCQSSADADEAMLQERRELRGLFESLAVKATSFGREINPSIKELAQEIRQLLKHRPTPISNVRGLVKRYQESTM
jgi:hypothetical protein